MGLQKRLRSAAKNNQARKDGRYFFSKSPIGPGMKRQAKREAAKAKRLAKQRGS